jgi:hypothetical protein
MITNSMNKKRKAGYVITILGQGVLVYFATAKYGDDFLWFFFGTVFLTTIMVSSNHEMKKLYWRKQIWRCDTCDKVITEDADLIVTFSSGGRTRRYDTNECMSAGVKDAFK